MITIHELSRKAYTEVLKVMPNAIKETEQEYDTVTIVFKPYTEIETNTSLGYITFRRGTNIIQIYFNSFHYITIS